MIGLGLFLAMVFLIVLGQYLPEDNFQEKQKKLREEYEAMDDKILRKVYKLYGNDGR